MNVKRLCRNMGLGIALTSAIADSVVALRYIRPAQLHDYHEVLSYQDRNHNGLYDTLEEERILDGKTIYHVTMPLGFEVTEEQIEREVPRGGYTTVIVEGTIPHVIFK